MTELDLTITNDGSSTASFEIRERDTTTAADGARAQQINGTFSPLSAASAGPAAGRLPPSRSYASSRRNVVVCPPPPATPPRPGPYARTRCATMAGRVSDFRGKKSMEPCGRALGTRPRASVPLAENFTNEHISGSWNGIVNG